MNDPPLETPEPLSVEISSPFEGVVLVVLAGEADILSTRRFGDRFAEVDRHLPAHVVFDLARLTFIDSTGINELVQAARSVEARGGTAVLAAPSPEARRVFEILGLSQVVNVEHDLDAALRPPRDGEGLAGVV